MGTLDRIINTLKSEMENANTTKQGSKAVHNNPINTLKGWFGETLTEGELMLVKLFGRNGKVLRNIYLPRDNGGTSEVDVVFISQKGIFVFECKNFSGWIFGNEKDKYWTASLPNGDKNKFPNPVFQNATHIRWMRYVVGPSVPLFSIISFSNRCTLKHITLQSLEVKVVHREDTYRIVREIWDKYPDALSENEINDIYEKLKTYTNANAETKVSHIENIENNFKEQDLICPKCGSKLVLRTASKGANAGNKFYGCSSFPNCRYIRNLND
ncbi:MAG: NERD domain-containing protein [Lachnospiraceae bacterium]|nr:NERD domain-containing protein [Lachnospiraceae bacterium]